MADPLSSATRATKRNLLVVSVLGISANAFNISIDKIPLAGLSVNFDDRLFAFLLVITLAYFLCTFVLYYIIDIKNLEATKHQTDTEAGYTKNLEDFDHIYAERIRTRLAKSARPKYDMPDIVDIYGNQFRVAIFRDHQYLVNRLSSPDAFGNRTREGVARASDIDLYASLDKLVDVWVGRMPAAWRWYYGKQRLLLIGTRAMYFTRNYFFDGMLPIVLGFFALIAILGHIDLHWIQRFLPTFKVLS
jgi:hypothetical protein